VAQPGLKRGTFSPVSLVLIATTGTKGPYQPGPKTVFLLVVVGGSSTTWCILQYIYDRIVEPLTLCVLHLLAVSMHKCVVFIVLGSWFGCIHMIVFG
jgi:hypothetical protein